MDIVQEDLGTQRIEEPDQRMFRCRIGSPQSRPDLPCRTGHPHDMPTLVPDHMGHDQLQMSEGSIRVHVHQSQVVLEGKVNEHAPLRYTRVLYHHVQLLAALLQPRQQLVSTFLYLREVRHVHLDALHPFRRRTRLLNFLQALQFQVRYDHVSPTSVELVGQGLTYP